MKNLSHLTLVFAALSVVFFLLLIFLRIPFTLNPLMSYQDAFDLLTPLVLIPIYWLMFKQSGRGEASRAQEVAFMALAALWVLGQGMHLSANSINNLAEGLAKKQVLNITGTDVYQLSHFYDEELSHYAWHVGLLGLAVVLLYREWRAPAGRATVWWATGLAGFLYGLTIFCVYLEGQTVPLGLPFVAGVTPFTLWRGRAKLGQQPLLAFFFIASLVALILFLGWGAYYRGFPEFSEVGLI